MNKRKPSSKKPVKKVAEQQHLFKLWGLQIPLKEPMDSNDAILVSVMMFVFLLVMSVFLGMYVLKIAGGVSTLISVLGWILNKFGKGQSR